MKADRMLAILLRLDTERRVTARELAQALDVSPRTVLRDLNSLSAAGVPVVAERGAHGGWFLLEPYRTDLSGLSAVEARALFLPLNSDALAHLGLAQAAAVGRAKLGAALSDAARAQAERMSRTIFVDTPGWLQEREAAQYLTTVLSALWDVRQLHFTYRRLTGEASERQLDPYGLVFKNGRWYVVGSIQNALRTFRVDRMEAVEVLDAPSHRPADFDLPTQWRQLRVDFLKTVPRYEVSALIHTRDLPGLDDRVRYSTVEAQDPAPDIGPEWWRVRLVFDTPGVALSYVLGFGGQLQVEQPEELREQLRRATKRLLTSLNHQS